MKLEHFRVLLLNHVEQHLLEALVQLNVVVEGVARVLHFLSLLGRWPKQAVSLSLNIKRFQTGNHLLIHNVVRKTRVLQRVHRYPEQFCLLH